MNLEGIRFTGLLFCSDQLRETGAMTEKRPVAERSDKINATHFHFAGLHLTRLHLPVV